jgi:hypothetical protein
MAGFLYFTDRSGSVSVNYALAASIGCKSTFNRHAVFLRLSILIRSGSPGPTGRMTAGMVIDETIIQVPMLPCTLKPAVHDGTVLPTSFTK